MRLLSYLGASLLADFLKMRHDLNQGLLGDAFEIVKVAIQVTMLACELLKIVPDFVVVIAAHPLHHIRVVAKVAVIDGLEVP